MASSLLPTSISWVSRRRRPQAVVDEENCVDGIHLMTVAVVTVDVTVVVIDFVDVNR